MIAKRDRRMDLAEAGLREARTRLGELVAGAQHAGHTTYLTRHGRRAAAIVPTDVVESSIRAEKRASVPAVAPDVSVSLQQADRIRGVLSNALKVIEMAAAASTDEVYQAKLDEFRRYFLSSSMNTGQDANTM